MKQFSSKKYLLPLIIPAAALMILAFLPSNNSGAGDAPHIDQSSDLTGSFTISGDPLVAPLSRVWAAEFMKLHPGVVITVVEDASSGIDALSRGAAIYQSMPRLGPAGAETASGIESNRIRIASDALSVIRWPWNPVELMTLEQVSGIYSGRIVNWKELGGLDEPIVVYAMPPGTPAYDFFKAKVLRLYGLPSADETIEFGSNVIFVRSAEEGNDLVAENPFAVFFTPVNIVTQEVTPTWIARTAGKEPSKACLETTSAGIFPIYRPLYYYTDGQPVGLVKEFIDFCLSEQGQDMVMLGGYLRLFFPNLGP
ncbi:substrate-binding domain-containing protein [Dehalogenimonas sp. 4OHTPN]|uniref:Substrate-binding domain-containing protein n=1 Tax=Dehalogenimonas sp. 4OHTPN TaxID=3166643 RepID=A0AAU8G7Z1_9CHLR